jgi:RNA polymerase-binding protein DksA
MVEKNKAVKASKTTDKKTTVRKTTARTRKKKTSITADTRQALDAAEIEVFHKRLLELRCELLGDMGHMQSDALDRSPSSGELSTMPVHMADVGSDNYEQEFVLGLVDTERKILEDIDRALAKIKEGRYGICEGTGQPISKARLEANPYARYCIEYARKIEKGFVRPENKFDTDVDE